MLSHIEAGLVAHNKERSLWQKALTHFNKRIILLTIPLFGIIALLLLHPTLFAFSPPSILSSTTTPSPSITQLFILLTSLYLFQLLFMAFTVVIEVKRHYSIVLASLTPYLALVGWYTWHLLGTSHTLPLSYLPLIIIGIHSTRLANLGIKTFGAYWYHQATFPFLYALKVSGVTIAISTIAYIIMPTLMHLIEHAHGAL